MFLRGLFLLGSTRPTMSTSVSVVGFLFYRGFVRFLFTFFRRCAFAYGYVFNGYMFRVYSLLAIGKGATLLGNAASFKAY